MTGGSLHPCAVCGAPGARAPSYNGPQQLQTVYCTGSSYCLAVTRSTDMAAERAWNILYVRAQDHYRRPSWVRRLLHRLQGIRGRWWDYLASKAGEE